jgi:hypothetical protein
MHTSTPTDRLMLSVIGAVGLPNARPCSNATGRHRRGQARWPVKGSVRRSGDRWTPLVEQ